MKYVIILLLIGCAQSLPPPIHNEGPPILCIGFSGVGCVLAGCPVGMTCELDAGCMPSSCQCIDSHWSCIKDCVGGICVPK